MITEKLMTAGLWILNSFLSVLDILPQMPDNVLTALEDFLSLVFQNAGLVGFFFPINFALPILTSVFFLANWKRIYHFILWIWHKIPISSD